MKESLRIDLEALLRGEITWKFFRAGIEIHPLYGEVGVGRAAALLRYAPGAKLPAHRHAGFEQILVLEGYQEDDLGRYDKGTLVINPPGTRHAVKCPEGCVVFVTWELPVEFEPE
ncbi:MAG TPA: cupin domain-containing protein [Polyangiaceae bacterium]|jgi:anti-sigma factor ChrR (cupin superfamily)|nr:cupin domain-containing protein [Polyangiaceae bacterium]